jgi:Ni/Co efflux regulator RcnB
MKRIAMLSLAASALVPAAAAAEGPEPHVAPAPHGAMSHHGQRQMHAMPGHPPRCTGAQHCSVRIKKRMHGPMARSHGDRVIRHHGIINGYPHYRRIDRGFVVPHLWWGPQFHVMNWGGYGLPRPMHGGRWIRYYDDALLIDGYGRVHDGRWNMKWDEWDREWAYDDRGVPVYVGNGDFVPGEEDYAWVEGQGGAHAQGHGYGGGYGHQGYVYAYPAWGYSHGMVITETTTTSAPTVVAETAYEEVVESAPRRVYRAKPKRHRAKPRPAPALPGERG